MRNFHIERGLRPRALLLVIGLMATLLAVPSAGPVHASEPVQANSTVTLTASNIHDTGATLTISGHSTAWYYKKSSPYHPSDRCSMQIPAGTSTTTLVGLDAATDYTFKAYSSSNCSTSTELATDDFTTSRVKLSPSRVFVPEEGTADYTVSLHTAPTASVKVSLSKSGDDDITISATDCDTTTSKVIDLCFTTTDYANPQTVRLSAADDDDKTSDTALIVHTATSTDSNYSNITSTLTATETDNDVCQGTPAVGNATSGGLVDDCNTLMAAKPVLSGLSSRLSDWSTGTAIGSWTGITAGSRVTGIAVRGAGNNKLGGSIPAGLGDLTNLTRLDLAYNNLTGPIPSTLSNLTSLNLSGNNLTGSIPSNLTKLTTLDLGSNRLTGPIPTNLTKLTSLKLGNNRLTGSIPTNLTKLTTLDLQGNDLDGSIPSSLGNLTNLTHLNLIRNGFTGSIPSSLGNLTHLTYLSLRGNKLTGIPTSLGDLANLTHLDLSINDLTGSIPSSLGNLTNLTHLDLSSNELSGDVPSELNNLGNVTHIGLSYNDLTGCYPSVFSYSPTQNLHPQNNGDNLPWCAGLAFYWKTRVIQEGKPLSVDNNNWYGFKLSTEPTADVTVKVSISGDPDLSIVGSTSFTFKTDTWATPSSFGYKPHTTPTPTTASPPSPTPPPAPTTTTTTSATPSPWWKKTTTSGCSPRKSSRPAPSCGSRTTPVRGITSTPHPPPASARRACRGRRPPSPTSPRAPRTPSRPIRTPAVRPSSPTTTPTPSSPHPTSPRHPPR